MTTLEDISEEIVRFFKNLLGTEDQACILCSVGELQALISYQPSQQVVDRLTSSVSDDDIIMSLRNSLLIKLLVQMGVQQSFLKLFRR